jgi:putative nucleotidyltransferase with HDIG domain
MVHMARGGNIASDHGATWDHLMQDDYAAGDLVIVAGIPGSGKSTLVACQFPGALVISPDAIRRELADTRSNSAGEWDQQVSARAFKIARSRLEKALRQGHSLIVLDATNLRSSDLGQYVQLAHTLRPRRNVHFVWVDVSIETARERNRNRGLVDPMREVPDAVIDRFHQAGVDLAGDAILGKFDSVRKLDESQILELTPPYDPPAASDPARAGLDVLDQALSGDDPAGQIRDLAASGRLAEMLPEVAETIGFDQRTNYHSQQLFEHLVAVLDCASEFGADLDVRWAALLHDVGKIEAAWECTVVHPTNPTQPQPHLHFYGKFVEGASGKGGHYRSEDHEVIGARMAERLTRDLGMSGERVRKITHLVRLHMDKGVAKPTQARKLINKAGEHLDDLLILHAADRAGHHPTADERAAAAALLHVEREVVAQTRYSDSQPKGPDLKLAVDGRQLHARLNLHGPQIGVMIATLIEEVSQGALTNDEASLMERAGQLQAGVRRQTGKSTKGRQKTRRR